MGTNIEIKARLQDPERTQFLVESLCGPQPEVIEQEDIFFRTPSGRLKLRVLGPDRGELIFYSRPDADGPKPSEYEIFRTAEPEQLKSVLDLALGTRGVVRKTRRLYLTGQTRIHLDRVEGLGDFLELEVVLEDGQDLEEGVRIAEGLMKNLEIEAGDLIEGAYVDFLV